MLPIVWNQELKQWEVQDDAGKPLWRGKAYADAAQFAEDYLKQQAFKSTILTGSVRG